VSGLCLLLAGPEGTELRVDGHAATIGRRPSCEVALDDPRVSGLHGEVNWRAGAWHYQDLGSTNGSMVRRGTCDLGVASGTEVPLLDGDLLLLGDVEDPVILRVVLAGPPAASPAELQATVIASRNVLEPAHGSLDVPGTRRLLGLLRDLAADPGRPDRIVACIGEFLFDLCPWARHLALEVAGGSAVPEPLVVTRGEAPLAHASPIPASLRRRATEAKEALLVADLAAAGDAAQSVVALGLSHALVAPLVVRDRTVGILLLGGGGAGLTAPGPGELDLFTAVAHHVAALVENARLHAELSARAERLRAENRQLVEGTGRGDIVGESRGLRDVLKQLDAVAPTDTTVLLLGETGTGKEVLARALHAASRRSEGAMMTINCGALALGVLESELFGHVKGAFTGADRPKQGLFDVADGGTLFLDEVGEMPAELQVRLLRVLQEGEVTPVGGLRSHHVDVRVVCATNRDLEEEVRQGRFREDLWYRLSVFPLRIPPLRERRSDVPLLARHLLALAEARLSKRFAGFAPEALDRLSAFDWPGNVRELGNEIERAALLAPAEGPIGSEHFSPRLQGEEPLPGPGRLKEAMAGLEAAYLRKALAAHDGNRSATARALGISRQGLIAKIARFGLD
jgi:transcriptional regulator with GAF, ATPase, and Fis domain